MLTEDQSVRKIIYLLAAIIAILFIILLLLTQAPATFIVDNRSGSLACTWASLHLGLLRDALMGAYIGAPLLQSQSAERKRGLRVRPPLVFQMRVIL
jgi:hypothetical protein